MNIREAAEKYKIPRSRIQRAISRGILPAAMVKNRWEIADADMEQAMARKRTVQKEDRTVIVREFVGLCFASRSVDKFATTAEANQFEELFNRSQST